MQIKQRLQYLKTQKEEKKFGIKMKKRDNRKSEKIQIFKTYKKKNDVIGVFGKKLNNVQCQKHYRRELKK